MSKHREPGTPGSFSTGDVPSGEFHQPELDFGDERIVILDDPEELEFQRQDVENRASFLDRLESLPPEVVQLVDFAYDLGKEAHRPQRRDTGERYFEHLRQVALILIDECNIKDPDVIVASLLHDSVEDSAMFGNRTQPYSEWRETSLFRLNRVFNEDVAEMVITLTKPKVDGDEITSKEQAHGQYIGNLSEAPARTILVKMADRLHNLRTLSGTTPDKQERIIAETREVYLPLFKKVLDEFPIEGNYLLAEMQKEIEQLEP